MKTLLLISILVGLVQAQTPPRLQKHLLFLDLGFTPVNYGGNHPFEHHWKLAGGDPYQLGVEYLDRRTANESLRIKFITDPINKGSASYSPLFEDTLVQEVSP
jgi:hypothetical protein